MSITENDRLDLRAKFEEIFGTRLAEIAMEAMPPLNYDQFATKQDVANLGIELRAEIGGLRGDMTSLEAGLRGDMTSLEAGLRGDMTALESSQRGTMASLESGLRGDMALMEARLMETMGKQFRQYFFANLAVMLTMVGLVVGLT